MFLSKLVLLPFRYLNFHSAIWCNDMSCISHVPNIFWVIQSYLNHISHIFSHNQGWGAYKSTNYAYIFRTRHHSTTIGWSSRRLILVSQSHCGTPWRCVFSRVAFASRGSHARLEVLCSNASVSDANAHAPTRPMHTKHYMHGWRLAIRMGRGVAGAM